MEEGYLGFFNRASGIYSSSGGHSRLLIAINSEELRDGLNGRKYKIAKDVLLDFFNDKNTKGNNRVFGISGYIEDLVRKCEEKEKIPNTALQTT